VTRALRHTGHVALRHVRRLLRQPAWVAVTLIQPMIWLLLFGALFKSVTEIPGFKGGSYIEYLTPGVVIMTAISSAGWSGMAFIDDMRSGVMDRMLASPVWRGALNAGTVAYGAFTVVIQTALIVLIALALGAHFTGGIGGVLLLILIAALLGAVFASLSNAVGLLARQRETVIGAVTFVQLPLTFLSVALMQRSLLPHWIRTVADYNPVNWAVEASRSAAMEKIDWSLVLTRIGLLTALLLVSAFLATRAFAKYQRSL
jgi:ABC-2 type transport system permease protein